MLEWSLQVYNIASNGKTGECKAPTHKYQGFRGKLGHPSQHRPPISWVYILVLQNKDPTITRGFWSSSKANQHEKAEGPFVLSMKMSILYNTIIIVTISISSAGFMLIEFIINMFRITSLINHCFMPVVSIKVLALNAIWYWEIGIRLAAYSIMEQQKTYGQQ